MTRAPLEFVESPFSATPDPARFCEVGSIAEARRRLTQAIDRAEGPSILVGPAGTGKTMLCQMLAEQYRTEYSIVLLAESRLCTRRALLQHILFHLSLPFRGLSEGELRLSLLDHLRPEKPEDNGLLLIIDEAHAMPRRLLEELRMISGVVRNGKPRVQLVMSGGMRLEETLADPRMESLEQRIAARAYLHPFSLEETRDYVDALLVQAGRKSSEVITDEAIIAAYHAADGIPRLLNRVLDRALQIGSAERATRLTRDLVDAAWSDLQQLPAPYADGGEASVASTSGSAIEFGQLDGDVDVDNVKPFPEAEPTTEAELEWNETGNWEESTVEESVAAEPAESEIVSVGWDASYDMGDFVECCNAVESNVEEPAAELACGQIELSSEITGEVTMETDADERAAAPLPVSEPVAQHTEESESPIAEAELCWGATAANLEDDSETPADQVAVSVLEDDCFAEVALPTTDEETAGVWFDWNAAAHLDAAAEDAEAATEEPVATSELVDDPFAEEFDEVFDLTASTRIVLADDFAPAPNGESLALANEASALQPTDVQPIANGNDNVSDAGPEIPVSGFEAEEAVHREVLSLSEVAEQSAMQENVVPPTKGKNQVFGLHEVPHDDRDLLIVEEAVRREAGQPGKPKLRESRNDYKSLFSQLRNG